MMILAGLLGLAAIGGIALTMDFGPTKKNAVPSEAEGQPDDPADAVVNPTLSETNGDHALYCAPAADQSESLGTDEAPSDKDPVRLMEFDPFVDRLVLLCNLENDSYPDLAVHREPGISRVSLNGRDLARIRTEKPISVDEIVLVDHCDPAAQGLGALQMQ
ncbi:hypothetical protein ACXYMO_07415 [Arenibacterium sp. CAU 1754]